jgi:hypothetical protein
VSGSLSVGLYDQELMRIGGRPGRGQGPKPAQPVRDAQPLHGASRVKWNYVIVVLHSWKTIRRELALDLARISRHNLAFGGPAQDPTMMQQCASTARLRSGGSNLEGGTRAMGCIG